MISFLCFALVLLSSKGKVEDIQTKMVLTSDKFFFFFRTGFQPIKDRRVIRLVRRGIHIGQVLFPMGIESDILQIRPWKELLIIKVQTTWFTISY